MTYTQTEMFAEIGSNVTIILATLGALVGLIFVGLVIRALGNGGRR